MPYDRDTLVENARKMLELADEAIPLLDAAARARGEKFRDGTRKARTALRSLSLGAVLVAHQMTQEDMLPLGELETSKAEFNWAYEMLAALNEFPAGALPELAAHAEEQGRMCLRCVGSRFRLLRDGLVQIVERTTGRRAAEPELAASDLLPHGGVSETMARTCAIIVKELARVRAKPPSDYRVEARSEGADMPRRELEKACAKLAAHHARGQQEAKAVVFGVGCTGAQSPKGWLARAIELVEKLPDAPSPDSSKPKGRRHYGDGVQSVLDALEKAEQALGPE